LIVQEVREIIGKTGEIFFEGRWRGFAGRLVDWRMGDKGLILLP